MAKQPPARGSWEWSPETAAEVMRGLSRTRLRRAQACREGWRFEGRINFPVVCGGTIYSMPVDAERDNGFARGSFSAALRSGRTAFKGRVIGLADPKLEAIRRGVQRDGRMSVMDDLGL